MATIQSLTDMSHWQTLWEEVNVPNAPSLLIFKRSPTCPTSFWAEGIFRGYVAALPERESLLIYSVDVVAARPISRQIAADTGIQHESPQAILINAGPKIAWNASHGDIDNEALTQYVPA
ncbi:MAG: monothiol bacilliredoxin BrxC family protein [Planctomycetota bacterium]